MENQIEVLRLFRTDSEGPVKAFVDISIAGSMVIKGIRVLEGRHGLFIGYPRDQSQDGKWYNTVYPTSPEFAKYLAETILKCYNVE